MEAGRKQLEQLVQMNLLQQQQQQAQLGQHPEMSKVLLEQLQMSQDSFNSSHLRNVSLFFDNIQFDFINCHHPNNK